MIVQSAPFVIRQIYMRNPPSYPPDLTRPSHEHKRPTRQQPSSSRPPATALRP